MTAWRARRRVRLCKVDVDRVERPAELVKETHRCADYYRDPVAEACLGESLARLCGTPGIGFHGDHARVGRKALRQRRGGAQDRGPQPVLHGGVADERALPDGIGAGHGVAGHGGAVDVRGGELRAVGVAGVKVVVRLARGRPDDTALSLEDVTDVPGWFAPERFNGDGVVIPECAPEGETRQVIVDAMACEGEVPDRSGKPGLDRARLRKGRWVARHLVLQIAHRFGNWQGRSGKTDAPTRHGVCFGTPVHRDDVVVSRFTEGGRAKVGASIVEQMLVNLIAHHLEIVLNREGNDVFHLLA